ncbi:MAG: UvrB/UvrC motif-containing protein [Longimicrobiales bacterium]
MQCDNCGNREAVIHLTQIVNNEMSTFHLCEECAAEKGLEPGASVGNFPLSDFLAQMGKGSSAEATAASAAACAFCGLKLEEFRKSGRLGCSHCYATFEAHLRGLLRRLHGGTQHVGKVYLPGDPTLADRQERLAGLRRKLDKAIQGEDFERAAQLRDQIRALETATS